MGESSFNIGERAEHSQIEKYGELNIRHQLYAGVGHVAIFDQGIVQLQFDLGIEE